MSTKTEFLRKVYEAGIAAGLTESAARVTAAQAALETGYGRTVKGNNLFGIKAGKSWTGDTQNLKTWEGVGGKKVRIVDKFRKYDSFEESLADRVSFMDKRFPGFNQSSTMDEAYQKLRIGGKSPYATDGVEKGDPLTYIDKLNMIGGKIPGEKLIPPGSIPENGGNFLTNMLSAFFPSPQEKSSRVQMLQDKSGALAAIGDTFGIGDTVRPGVIPKNGQGKSSDVNQFKTIIDLMDSGTINGQGVRNAAAPGMRGESADMLLAKIGMTPGIKAPGANANLQAAKKEQAIQRTPVKTIVPGLKAPLPASAGAKVAARQKAGVQVAPGSPVPATRSDALKAKQVGPGARMMDMAQTYLTESSQVIGAPAARGNMTFAADLNLALNPVGVGASTPVKAPVKPAATKLVLDPTKVAPVPRPRLLATVARVLAGQPDSQFGKPAALTTVPGASTIVPPITPPIPMSRAAGASARANANAGSAKVSTPTKTSAAAKREAGAAFRDSWGLE